MVNFMKRQDEDLPNSQTQKVITSSETWESLGLTWLREETDRATEIMLAYWKGESSMQKSLPKAAEEFVKLNNAP